MISSTAIGGQGATKLGSSHQGNISPNALIVELLRETLDGFVHFCQQLNKLGPIV
eukprot:CAMPEP_0172467782 /NCGR_PEP_ID=MMETSP1065-20121228/59815_1 /TAXON_ID=265537 /ORGANISM="Amphiprora paludosa, Strain CCMP125" /LENGTH=54 /DNA_ID=CAMNT_0013225025 /DNA_START=137 /DNA_END=301 /DNA_ORIENTATION=-